jgi:hypothetical protein
MLSSPTARSQKRRIAALDCSDERWASGAISFRRTQQPLALGPDFASKQLHELAGTWDFPLVFMLSARCGFGILQFSTRCLLKSKCQISSIQNHHPHSRRSNE